MKLENKTPSKHSKQPALLPDRCLCVETNTCAEKIKKKVNRNISTFYRCRHHSHHTILICGAFLHFSVGLSLSCTLR